MAAVASLAPSSYRELAATLQADNVPVAYIPHLVSRAEVSCAYVLLARLLVPKRNMRL